MFNVKKELRAKIGYLTAHGNMIWGAKGLNIALSIISEFRFNDQPYKFLTQIQPVKELRIQDLETKEEGLPKIFQIYNNKIKEKLRQMKMVELSRGKYFNNEMKADDEIH